MKRPLPKGPGLAVFLLFAAAFPLGAQFDPGQYTDEAPFRTWNSSPGGGAAALGRGLTAFAWGTDASVSPANPALLLTLPKGTVAVGGSFVRAAAMRFGPVNSGVLTTTGPVGAGVFTGDHAAVSVRSGRFAFTVGVFLSELYNRPEAEAFENENQARLYTIRYAQTGLLRTVHLAAAFRLSPRLGFGLGLNTDSGRLESEFLEDIAVWGYRFTSVKSASLRGFSLNGGLFWEVSPAVRAALTFRTPSTLRAETETVDRYEAPLAGTDISIRGTSDDSFERPLALGAGVTVKHGDRLRTAFDVSWQRWSGYSAVWLGTPQPRDFHDTVRLSAGGEYTSEFRLFGKRAVSPFRLGLVYDPQPPASPRSAYLSVSVGTGIEIGRFRVDLGMLAGSARDREDRLTAVKISLSCGYAF